jgi:hypothetical protein
MVEEESETETTGWKFYMVSSSATVCMMRKERGDEYSIFNLFVVPNYDLAGNRSITVLIDNEKVEQRNWLSPRETTVSDVYKAYGAWASGCPKDFDTHAQNAIRHCLHSELRSAEISTEYGLKGGVDFGIVKVEGSAKKEKKSPV